MSKIRELTKATQEVFIHDVVYWDFYRSEVTDADLDKDINAKLQCHVSGMGHNLATYAINYCILAGSESAVKELCEKGADLTVQDSWHHNKTPLKIAIEYGRAKIVDILLKHGASLPEGHEVEIPTANSCCSAAFFWKLKERLNNREVDYDKVQKTLFTISRS